MILHFEKYHGAGNDFIMVDDRSTSFDIRNLDLVQRLCDRRFGIGADGLILIREHPELDFHMIYFNADGTQSFCGNGSRCAMVFAASLGMVSKQARFLSTDGTHEAEIIGDRVRLKMHDVASVEHGADHYFINTGSPHWIEFTDQLDGVDVYSEARKIRYNERFCEDGTNVNYAQLADGGIRIRTYERGVENITLACGTGVTAVALAGSIEGKLSSPVNVKADGGDLSVEFEGDAAHGFKNIWLIGPAEKVFEGKLEI